MSEVPYIADLFVLGTPAVTQHKLKPRDLDIIAQFNGYMRVLAGGDIHTIQRSVLIEQESGTSYLKVQPVQGGTTFMIVDPVQLVKTLARPFEERSGVPFNLTLES